MKSGEKMQNQLNWPEIKKQYEEISGKSVRHFNTMHQYLAHVSDTLEIPFGDVTRIFETREKPIMFSKHDLKQLHSSKHRRKAGPRF